MQIHSTTLHEVNVKFLLCKLNAERFHNYVNIIVGIHHFFREGKKRPYDFACIHCINFYGHVQEYHKLHGILELHAILVFASQPDSSCIVSTLRIVLTGCSHTRSFNSNLDSSSKHLWGCFHSRYSAVQVLFSL